MLGAAVAVGAVTACEDAEGFETRGPAGARLCPSACGVTGVAGAALLGPSCQRENASAKINAATPHKSIRFPTSAPISQRSG